MNNKEILDNAPDWADTHRKLLDYPDCTTYANNADDEQVLDRSLADIKRIVELEKERESLLRLISYVKSIVFSKVKCSYVSFKRPLEELLKD